MPPIIICEFWVKACSYHIVLLNSNNCFVLIANSSKHFHLYRDKDYQKQFDTTTKTLKKAYHEEFEITLQCQKILQALCSIPINAHLHLMIAFY